MARYAKATSVPVSRSQDELKRTLERYGADEVVVVDSQRRGKGMVQFIYHDLPIRVVVDTPKRSETRFHEKADGSRYSESQGTNSWKLACRQMWRVLVLLVKAQLESVEQRVLKPEEAFYANLLLPGGKTLVERDREQLKHYVDHGQPPRGLLEMGEESAKSA